MTAVSPLRRLGGTSLHLDGAVVIPAETVGLGYVSRAFLLRNVYVGEFAESRRGTRGRAKHGPESFKAQVFPRGNKSRHTWAAGVPPTSV